MKRGGIGGGNTITGLIYEAKVDLATFLDKQVGYRVDGTLAYYNNLVVAHIFKKYGLYKYLDEYNVDWKNIYPSNYCLTIVFM